LTLNSLSSGQFYSSIQNRAQIKVIYPKYSKHWPYTVAHTIDCVWIKMLDHGLNYGLFLSLFKFLHENMYKNKFKIKRNRLLYCFRFQAFTWNTSYSARNQPIFICPNGCAKQLFSNVYSTWDVCITFAQMLRTWLSTRLKNEK
jgi:hypothetical protein